MKKPTILLGAGASMDAGLPGAFDLTKNIYDKLVSRHPPEAKLFAYVLSKLITRQSKRGISPFLPINVEIVFDALKKYLARDDDLLSEFVYSWDSINPSSGTIFDKEKFIYSLSRAFSFENRGNRIHLVPNGTHLEQLADSIGQALQPGRPKYDLQTALSPYLQVLVECLTPKHVSHKYIHDLVNFASRKGATIATLNYDTLFEDNMEILEIDFDYGLKLWNSRRYVQFRKDSLNFIKLHGSISWIENDDRIEIDNNFTKHAHRGIIFGGQSDKLVPHGPYLQLRHEFQKIMRSSNVLGVVGYSFQDRHLNAILRAWVNTRLNAKMVILDPGVPRLGSDVLGINFMDSPDRKTNSPKVEFVQIKKGAQEGMDEFISAISTPPNPTRVISVDR